jgi:hypothetical protein
LTWIDSLGFFLRSKLCGTNIFCENYNTFYPKKKWWNMEKKYEALENESKFEIACFPCPLAVCTHQLERNIDPYGDPCLSSPLEIQTRSQTIFVVKYFM